MKIEQIIQALKELEEAVIKKPGNEIYLIIKQLIAYIVANYPRINESDIVVLDEMTSEAGYKLKQELNEEAHVLFRSTYLGIVQDLREKYPSLGITEEDAYIHIRFTSTNKALWETLQKEIRVESPKKTSPSQAKLEIGLKTKLNFKPIIFTLSQLSDSKIKPIIYTKKTEILTKLKTATGRERELMELILRYKFSYYVLGIKEVTDAEYDHLEKELNKINPDNPVLSLVGSDLMQEGKQKVKLEPRMLSAAKLETIDMVQDWAGDWAIVWGYKIDGLSLNIEYFEGKLFRASTRGDSDFGENMTAQALNISNVPKTISTTELRVIVRGEAFMPISKLGNYKAARNLAVGSLRKNDASAVKERGVLFYAWDLIFPSNDTLPSIDKIKWLKEHGFDTADQELIKPEEATELFEDISLRKSQGEFDFEMDGLVFKINSPERKREMGETDTAPRWMVAVKFPTEERVTTITEILWQVGRTGKITPRASVTPVEVPGATLEHATLHNAKYVRDNKLSIGDEILITRSGDVIPYVLKVTKHSGGKMNIPELCPICEHKLKDDSTNLFCINLDCDGRNLAWIKHYINIIGIMSLGEERIEELFDLGTLRHPADLYKLTERQWMVMKIKGRTLGENGRNIFNSIQEHKKMPMNLFIESLNIERVGKKSASIIASSVDSWKDLVSKSLVDFKAMNIGNITSESIYQSLKDNRQKFEKLINAGIEIVIKERVKAISGGKLNGIKVYVTGVPPGIPKDKLQEIIEKNGGVWGWSEAKTKILVVAPKGAGEAKIKIANERKMEVIGWDAFSKKYEIKM